MSELRASNESLVRDLKQKTEELNAVAESFRQSESLTKDLKEQLLGAEAGNDKKDKEIKLLENKLKSMEEYLKGILKKNDEATMQFQAQKVRFYSAFFDLYFWINSLHFQNKLT